MPSAKQDYDGADRDDGNSVRTAPDKNLPAGEKPQWPKVVSIEQRDWISPLMLAKNKEVDDFNLDANPRSPRKHHGRLGRRVLGKMSSHLLSPSLHPLHSEPKSVAPASSDAPSSDSQSRQQRKLGSVLEELAVWIEKEKSKQHSRRARRKGKRPGKKLDASVSSVKDRSRRDSYDSDSSVDLNGLETILEKGMHLSGKERTASRRSYPRRMSSARSLRRYSTAASSDTDFVDGEQFVPGCDAVLDNSRTLGYTGGEYNPSSDALQVNQAAKRAKEDWSKFKFEIVRLTHTLRLKGWRQVPMQESDKIDVERLSGALTNAVYVVSPPDELYRIQSKDSGEGRNTGQPRRQPKKLLLRIYGPQVEHLIDRDRELLILRRLSRKNIGPRLLGTFTNGRFEEFLYAQTLTPQDLRVPETSIQIAKRMRELHDGIDLLHEERHAGAFVWQNWDKWVDRCEKIVTFLDKDAPTAGSDVDGQGLVCGVEWSKFRRLVERFRKWMEKQYGGSKALADQMVFAHNDTQYGNILRLEPPGESPLLLPANKHRQLIVIDFEYANANVPGFDIVNHFTEWCYNYHDPVASHICNTSNYPTPDEQYRFIRAYVVHRPHFLSDSAASSRITTPKLGPTQVPSPTDGVPAQSVASSLAAYIAEARAPGGASAAQATSRPSPVPDLPPRKMSLDGSEAESSPIDESSGGTGSSSFYGSEALINEDVRQLTHEARLWRVACSAQWVVWGILQAHVPGMPAEDADEHGSSVSASGESTDADAERDGEHQPANGQQDGGANGDADGEAPAGADAEQAADGGFDYLRYARDRAMFFWGDCLQLGLVKEEDLPADVRKGAKFVRY